MQRRHADTCSGLSSRGRPFQLSCTAASGGASMVPTSSPSESRSPSTARRPFVVWPKTAIGMMGIRASRSATYSPTAVASHDPR